MAITKEINLFLNLKARTPDSIIESLRKFKINSEEPACKVLCSDYHHTYGQPVIDFYATGERLGQHQIYNDTHYLRYANTIEDYDNEFETWLESVAPWIIQINGRYVGTLFTDANGDPFLTGFFLISIEDEKVVYKRMTEC